jgi:hypothetical protein
MNLPLASLHEKPFTVLDGFSEIKDQEITDPNVIVRAGAQKLFAWWFGHVERHGALPTRNAFDILTMLPHAAHMFLATCSTAGTWRYHLQGEEFKRLYSGGFQRDADIHRSFAAFPKPVSVYLNSVADGRACRRSYGTITGNVGNRNTFESIDCPLIDLTGRVTHIIGIAELFRGPKA